MFPALIYQLSEDVPLLITENDFLIFPSAVQDRVMINRLDNVCETVVKGKWPVNRRQLFDFPGLLPGYTPSAMDSPLQRRSFAELSMVGQASYSGSEDIAQSPQISKARLKCSDVQKCYQTRFSAEYSNFNTWFCLLSK